MGALKQVYKGEALKTYEKIRGNHPISSNQLYQNDNILFYINTKGYLHVYKPTKYRFMDRVYYGLNDFLLTTDNMLSDKGILYQSNSIEELDLKIRDLLAS